MCRRVRGGLALFCLAEPIAVCILCTAECLPQATPWVRGSLSKRHVVSACRGKHVPIDKRQRTQGASRARVTTLSESSPEGQAANSAALKAMRSSLRTPGRAPSNPTKLDSTPAGVDRASAACSEDSNPARPDGQPEATRSNSGRLRIPNLGKLNIQDNHSGVNNGREHPAMLGHRAGLGQSHDLRPLEVRA